MSNRKVPISLADPNANVYNATDWEQLRTGVANAQFTAVEIKAFYVIGLILEICASVDCLLKADSFSEDDHPLAYEIFRSGGRYLPAFGVFASGIELLGRCLTGNETPNVNQNLRVGFYYLASPTATPLLDPDNTQVEQTNVITTSHPYSVQDLIDLRNYAAHGQSTVGQRNAAGRRVPMSSPPGIERELFGPLPRKMGGTVETYWASLQSDADHCGRLARSRIDPYSNRIGPLRHVIGYFGQIPYQSASSLFDRFKW
jgi:hypothetical protein